MAPVAETFGLTRRFGTTVAVDNLDLTIPRGVVYGLLGPNGSGKTTAMRLLTGLLTPTAGRVTALGLDLPRDAERLKTRIGYMTQGFTYYGDLTVLENLRFIAEIHDLSAKTKRRRVDELLETYDLRERANTLAGALSGGQRQRLALAATVIHDPDSFFSMNRPPRSTPRPGALSGRGSSIWWKQERVSSCRPISWTRPSVATGSQSWTAVASALMVHRAI